MKDFPVQDLLHYPDDGTGAPGGTGTPPSGDPNAQAPAATVLTDDSLVDFGDGKPVKWKDARTTRYMDRSEYDLGTQRIEKGREFLVSEARKLEAAWQRYEDGRGAKPQQTRPDIDLLDQIQSMPVVDGATIRKLYQSGMAPMAQLLTQQNATIKQLTERLDRTERFGQHTEADYNERQFAAHITKHLKAIGEVKGFQGRLADYTDDPIIREIARDVWTSYDQNTWTDASFQAEVARRVEGMVALVRKADRAFADKRKEEGRQRFLNPRQGNGNPQGAPQYVHKNGQALAAEMWAARGLDNA